MLGSEKLNLKFGTKMRALVLLSAVFCAATVKADDLKQQFQACVDATHWTKDEFGQTCNSDPPSEPTALARHKEFSFCILRAAKIIEDTGAGIEIHPENSAALSAPGRESKAAEIIHHCAPNAKAQPTLLDAAMELSECFRKSDREEYNANCQAFTANVFP